jgi:hypothetical protein
MPFIFVLACCFNIMPQLLETDVAGIARIERTVYPSPNVADNLLPDVIVVLSPSPAPPPSRIGTTIPGKPARTPVGDANSNDVDALECYHEATPKAHLMDGHVKAFREKHGGFGGLGDKDEMERAHLPMCLAQEDGIVGVTHN